MNIEDGEVDLEDREVGEGEVGFHGDGKRCRWRVRVLVEGWVGGTKCHPRWKKSPT